MQPNKPLGTAIAHTLTMTLIAACMSAPVGADCPDGPSGFAPAVPNVVWYLGDNVTGCPAGDTTNVAGHPSRLRVVVEYRDANCNPKVGVPPESLKITWAALGGTSARINDKSALGTFADDPTDINGQTRFTFPSLSGCGNLRLFLTVANVSQGTKDAAIRTVDKDIDLERRVTLADRTNPCDLDWSGYTYGDVPIVDAHMSHWRRNALHGTLVRRTNVAATGPNRIGESTTSWSPNGRWLAYTVHVKWTLQDLHSSKHSHTRNQPGQVHIHARCRS